MSAFYLESFLAQQRWQAFQSTETVKTIPPFAPVQLGSGSDPTRAMLDEDSGEFLLLAGQVRSVIQDFTIGLSVSCEDIAFNGPIEVLPGERGALTFDTPCISRFIGSTAGLLVPLTIEFGGAGWELQNTLPHTGDDTCVPCCFRKLGLISISGRDFITIQRIRYSAFFQTQKLFH